MKTEKQKMLDGEYYLSSDKELTKLRKSVRNVLYKFNLKSEQKYLKKIFGKKLKNVYIEAPFYCDYGINTELGENVYMNFNCTILDCAKVKIGDNTMFAPNVQIYTATHPIEVEKRINLLEYAKPITIGKNCWLGGGVIVLPNVTIGDNCVIGAGSVVTKDVPANSVVAGNPARVIKSL